MHRFRCRRCGRVVDPDDRPAGCPDCPGRLVVEADPDPGDAAWLVGDGSPPGDRDDLWRYRDLLPAEGIDPPGLGAGGTPLVPAPRLSPEEVEVWVKDETRNPTDSWKDRLNALQPPRVAGPGDRVVVSSSGNQGASLAAYASRLGLDALVFLHPDAEPPAAAKARAYGATVARLTNYEGRFDLIGELLDRDWLTTYDLDGVYTGQPYVYEAHATIAYEIVEDLGVPDAVAVPVGSGDGLYGIWKGFRTLADLGVVESVPRMIAAEQAERAPLTRAFESGAAEVGEDEGPMPASTSTAGTTAGEHALDAVRDSGGTAFAIPPEEMEEALRKTARDGVFVEPASALASAAATRAIDDGVIEAGEEVVTVASGSGATWPEKTAEIVGGVPTVEPTLDGLAELGVVED